ncbi:MAG: hypothetical protein ISEC1_P1139 [Thiomicrorhabdus sp.]|nr:MAG: hypothetical protein ISEC1_P1139 [Thiomicrorhabdus sp.]
MNLKKIAQHCLIIPFLGLSLSVHAAEKSTDKPADAAEEQQNAEQIKKMEQEVAAQLITEKAAEKKRLAAELTKFKKRGLIGERANGYIAPVRPSRHTNELVRKINQGRLEHYARIAQKANYSVIQIEIIAGEKARANEASGHYIEKDRLWIKKP